MKNMAFLLGAAGLMLSSSTWAQAPSAQSPLKVCFQSRGDWATRILETEIRKSLSAAPFKLSDSIDPDTLVVSIPDGISYKNTESETTFQFTAVFTKNGDKIGESDESCSSRKLSDCTDQLASDTISANQASSKSNWNSAQ